MFKISKQLREDLIKAFFQLNAPVQTYVQIEKALMALEEIVEPKQGVNEVKPE